MADAKVEIEKLREDLKRKADLSENLKRAHQEQAIRIQEANSKFEGQVQELNEKTGEISVVK
ncbi:hypothetical protein K8353_50175, partial [Burkholderia contaminans]|nr:hypothetical protein [Burkholderia contaminans]